MRYAIIPCLLFLLCCCTNKKETDLLERVEDLKAKELLQGIWVDDENDIPWMRVEGDTIYFVDPLHVPVYFKIIKDSLYTFGNEVGHYRIDQQSESAFCFHALSNYAIKLYKSENLDDSLAFYGKKHEPIPIYTEVTQRDSILFYNNIRYRAYVYINPSTIKVIKTTYSEEGLSLDYVYFDNIIHICVYRGKDCLYANDISRKMFVDMIPDELLKASILSEMNIMGVDRTGFKYQAIVCIPESYECRFIDLTVGFDGKLDMRLADIE